MISIIIPTHNRRAFLVEAVESVIGQRFQDWELIVVDDGSEDSTRAAIQKFEDRRIRYLFQEHRGVSAARNRGIAEARYPWITFLDSDDLWLPPKLNRQLEVLDQQPEFQVAYTNEIWIRRGTRVNPRSVHRKYHGWIYDRCLPLCIISPSSVLMHREVFSSVGVFDERYPVCEDYDLWLRISAGFPVYFLDEDLIIKRGGHPDQLSKSRWGLDRYRLRALLSILRSGHLSPQQEEWTREEIGRKAAILASGSRKRGKPRAYRYFRSICEEMATLQSAVKRS